MLRVPLVFFVSLSLLAQTSPDPPSAQRPVSWKLLLPNIGSDQVRIWTFPARVFKRKNWIPTAAVLAVTAGLIAADPSDARYFRKSTAFHGFNSALSGNNTALATAVIPGALYAAGLLRRDSYAQNTALLAGEAVAGVEILTTVFKQADRRLRPSDIPPTGNFADSWTDSRGGFLSGHGSFPSGHTIAAFSVATVISRRYPQHRWIPFVAYGAATAIGFARVTESAHYPSDVFMGAALGYSISRFVVLR